jgi:hypothetical protein
MGKGILRDALLLATEVGKTNFLVPAFGSIPAPLNKFNDDLTMMFQLSVMLKLCWTS